MVTIKMPNEYWNVLLHSLDVAHCFYTLDFENGFQRLFQNGFNENVSINAISENSSRIKKMLFPDKYQNVLVSDKVCNQIVKLSKLFEKHNGSYDLTDSELRECTAYLDFIIRIWLGQWEEFQRVVGSCVYEHGRSVSSCYFMEDDILSAVTKCRTDMISVFPNHGIIYSNSSFGIYSDTVSDDIRKLYQIYKAIRFSLSGSENDVETVCGKNPVSVTFPYEDEYIVSDIESAIDWLSIHPVPGYGIGEEKSFIFEDGKLYVLISNEISISVDSGDTIYLCHNRRFDIKKENRLYTYFNNV